MVLQMGGLFYLVESLGMAWNLIKRQLIVASEIYQQLYIANLILDKPQGLNNASIN